MPEELYTRKEPSSIIIKTLGDSPKLRIINVKQTSVQEARDRIEEYLKQHQGPAYPSEIADHYGLELEPTFEAIKQLIAEGKTKETK